jgi:hypothetical protein
MPPTALHSLVGRGGGAEYLLYRLLESVTAKPTHERMKGGADRPPLGPLVSGLCTLPPRVRYTPGVTLFLVEFQISL